MNNNNKRKTLDSYFSSSTQKKNKSLDDQSDDCNSENVIFETSDSNLLGVTNTNTNDKPVEISLLNSFENINIETQQDVQHGENIINETISDVIDISRSRHHPPTQPKLRSYPKNNENRSFMVKWYDNRPWLEYSINKDASYCYYCRHFGVPASSSNTKPQTGAFTNNGYKNWRKALDKSKGFDQHLKSYGHVLAANNYTVYQQREQSQSNVINVLDKGRIEQIRKNRERLTKIASTLLLCSRQCIGIRGHDESEK